MSEDYSDFGPEDWREQAVSFRAMYRTACKDRAEMFDEVKALEAALGKAEFDNNVLRSETKIHSGRAAEKAARIETLEAGIRKAITFYDSLESSHAPGEPALLDELSALIENKTSADLSTNSQ